MCYCANICIEGKRLPEADIFGTMDMKVKGEIFVGHFYYKQK